MLRELQTPQAIGDLSLNSGPKYHSNLSLPHFLPVLHTLAISEDVPIQGGSRDKRNHAQEKPDASSNE